MIAGLGVDILSLPRFKEFIIRRGVDKVAKRICSVHELGRFEKLRVRGGRNGSDEHGKGLAEEDVLDKQVRFLSSRWCIKEAAYKSLFPLLPKPPSFKTFELVHSSSGQPTLDIIVDNIKDKYALMTSISHDAGVVVGVVISLDKSFGAKMKGLASDRL